jgi:hypothetical protein
MDCLKLAGLEHIGENFSALVSLISLFLLLCTWVREGGGWMAWVKQAERTLGQESLHERVCLWVLAIELCQLVLLWWTLNIRAQKGPGMASWRQRMAR